MGISLGSPMAGLAGCKAYPCLASACRTCCHIAGKFAEARYHLRCRSPFVPFQGNGADCLGTEYLDNLVHDAHVAHVLFCLDVLAVEEQACPSGVGVVVP